MTAVRACMGLQFGYHGLQGLQGFRFIELLQDLGLVVSGCRGLRSRFAAKGWVPAVSAKRLMMFVFRRIPKLDP